MAKFSGYLFTLAAIGLLLYGDPRGVDIATAYAWVVAVLSMIMFPLAAAADPTFAYKTVDDARKAKRKIKLAWGFLSLVIIGVGLAFHGEIVAAVFYLVAFSLMKIVLIGAADARIKQDADAA